MPKILIENISRKFGSFQAVDRINLEIEAGSLDLLRESGMSGKFKVENRCN